MKKLLFTIAISITFMMVGVSWGQTTFTATYNLSGNGNDVTSFNYNGTIYLGIVPGALVKVGITSNSSTGNYRGSNWPRVSIDLGYYIGFTIDAAPGFKFTVTSITFGVGRSSTGPKRWQWRGSNDSFSSVLKNYTTLNAGLTNKNGELTNPDVDGYWTGNVLEAGSNYVNQTTTVIFRLYGYNSEKGSGTGGLQGNITIKGTFESLGGVGGTPTKLAVTNINNGSSPSVNTPFDVVVQSQDNSGAAQNVTTSTDVTLSRGGGTGTLGGTLTLTGTILAGQNKVTIPGVTYNIAESGVSVTATASGGDPLSTGTSTTFKVLEAASQLAFVNLPFGAQQHKNLVPFMVEARRADNFVDLNFTGNITIAKFSGLGAISGTLTQNAVAGVATFNNIQFDAAGTYTISASSSDLSSITSGNINILSTSLPLTEDFYYTDATTLVSNGWTAYNSAGANSISVNSSGLTFTNYPWKGGNSALLNNTGEDVDRTFTTQTSGSLYISFLVNVTSAASGYFLFLSENPVSTVNFRGRIFLDASNKFGLSFGSNTATLAPSSFELGATYLLVMRYKIVAGDNNDQVSLYVFKSGDDFSTEPATPTIGPLTDATLSDIDPGSIALRQFDASQNLVVDEIRIGTSWSEAPLPVELTSFTASTENAHVYLKWNTATEENNYGFEIQRSAISGQQPAESWNKIGFVRGNGNSNSSKSYSFVDPNVTSGKYYYRLKQIDNDGKFEYSKIVEVNFSIPDVYELNQNYPNPFNPVTTIKYEIPKSSEVKLVIFDMLGREVITLVDEYKDAGRYNVQFDASKLASGTYLYKIQAGSFVEVKKMILMK